MRKHFPIFFQKSQSTREADFLDVDEAKRFLAAVDPRYRPIFITAIYTGLRYGELIRLQWRDINWDFNRIAVRDPKNDEARYVPMNQAVRKALLALAPSQTQLGKGTQQIFTNPGMGNLYESVRAVMKRALKQAGVTRHIRFHDLRHTTGSHLAMGGATEREIAEVLGHRNTQVTRRYTHLSPSHVQGLVDRLNFEAEEEEVQKKVESP